MKAKLAFGRKQVTIEDIKKVSSIGKYTGLMFKPKETRALLFSFGKGRKAIHSCFCKPFLAVWLLEGKIVDHQLITPFRLSITPISDYDTLIEIPFNNKYSHVVNFFIERERFK
jgi:uncharacterized membrane protein (UPF0127 family)